MKNQSEIPVFSLFIESTNWSL